VGWYRRNLPRLVLTALAFGIRERLTGSTSGPGLVTSLTFPLGRLLYGSGVVLVRDSALRWRKRWVGILLVRLIRRYEVPPGPGPPAPSTPVAG
jgi:hypothetical protein